MVWYVTIADLAPEKIANGVRNLQHHKDKDGRNEYPPNAGQFRDLCINNFDWERQCHKEMDRSTLLENTTGKEKRAAEGLANIRKLREETGL